MVVPENQLKPAKQSENARSIYAVRVIYTLPEGEFEPFPPEADADRRDDFDA